MKNQILLFGVALTLTAHAQNSWTNRYNGPGDDNDAARAIAVDANGNVFVTGGSAGTGRRYWDYATIKYSSEGVPLWTNRYGFTFDDVPYAIAVDGSGDVYVTGLSLSDYVTVKYSNAGVPLWTNHYNGPGNGNDAARAIAVDTNGDVFVTGDSAGIGFPGADYATIKYSNAGVPLWTNRYNGPGDSEDYAVALEVDDSGNVFVTGHLEGGVADFVDYLTIAYSNAGTPLWTNRYSTPGDSFDEASDIAIDGSGNVLVTGSPATIKYSNAGVPLWTNLNAGKAVASDGSGNAFVVGSSYSASSGFDYATIKYSSGGMPLWTNVYNGPVDGFDDVAGLVLDDSGNVFVTGLSPGSGSGNDYATVAYSNAGVPLWTNRYNGQANAADGASAIAVDAWGNVFVTGFSQSGSGNDYATIKYAAVSVPPIALLENTQVTAGDFSFDVVAEPTGQFAIQVSTNLIDWAEIRQVVIPAGGSTNIVETLAPGAGQHFYRAQRQ